MSSLRLIIAIFPLLAFVHLESSVRLCAAAAFLDGGRCLPCVPSRGNGRMSTQVPQESDESGESQGAGNLSSPEEEDVTSESDDRPEETNPTFALDPLPPAIVKNIGGPFLTSGIAAIVSGAGYLPALDAIVGLDSNTIQRVAAIAGTPGVAYLAVYTGDKLLAKTPFANCVAAPKGALGSQILKLMRYLNANYLETVPGGRISSQEKRERIREGKLFLDLCRRISGTTYADSEDQVPSLRALDDGSPPEITSSNNLHEGSAQTLSSNHPLRLLATCLMRGGQIFGTTQRHTQHQRTASSSRSETSQSEDAISIDDASTMPRQRRLALVNSSRRGESSARHRGTVAGVADLDDHEFDNDPSALKALEDMGAFILNLGRRVLFRNAFCTSNGFRGLVVGAASAGFACAIVKVGSTQEMVDEVVAAALIGLMTPYAVTKLPHESGGVIAGGVFGGLLEAGIIPGESEIGKMVKKSKSHFEKAAPVFVSATCGAIAGHFLRSALNPKLSRYPKLASSAVASTTAAAAASVMSGSPVALVVTGLSGATYGFSNQIGDLITRLCCAKRRTDKGLSNPIRRGSNNGNSASGVSTSPGRASASGFTSGHSSSSSSAGISSSSSSSGGDGTDLARGLSDHSINSGGHGGAGSKKRLDSGSPTNLAQITEERFRPPTSAAVGGGGVNLNDVGSSGGGPEEVILEGELSTPLLSRDGSPASSYRGMQFD